MISIFDFFRNDIKVIWDLCIYDNIKHPHTKTQITQTINDIRKDNPGKTFKIGMSGDPEYRAVFPDYRSIASITKIFVLYCNSDPDIIAEVELYYIRKYKDLHPIKCLNKTMELAGNMISPDGNYYVYLAI